jgi:hypothetical protein
MRRDVLTPSFHPTARLLSAPLSPHKHVNARILHFLNPRNSLRRMR